MPTAAKMSIRTPAPTDGVPAAPPTAAELFAALMSGAAPQPAGEGDAPEAATEAAPVETAEQEGEPSGAAEAAMLLPMLDQQRAATPAPVVVLPGLGRSVDPAAPKAAAPAADTKTVPAKAPMAGGELTPSGPETVAAEAIQDVAAAPGAEARPSAVPASAVPPQPSIKGELASEANPSNAQPVPIGDAAPSPEVAPAIKAAVAAAVMPDTGKADAPPVQAKAAEGAAVAGDKPDTGKADAPPVQTKAAEGAPAPAAAVAATATASAPQPAKPALRIEAGAEPVEAAKGAAVAEAPALPQERPAAASSPSFQMPAPGAAAAAPALAQPLGAQIAAQVLDLARGGEWIDQLARDISNASGADGPLRFRLTPETLGELRVEITQSERGAHIRMHVTSEAAQQAIADAQPRLAAEARAQGVRIAESEVSFTGGDAGRDAGRQAQSQPDQPLRAFRTGGSGSGAANPSTVTNDAAGPAGPRRTDRYA